MREARLVPLSIVRINDDKWTKSAKDWAKWAAPWSELDSELPQSPPAVSSTETDSGTVHDESNNGNERKDGTPPPYIESKCGRTFVYTDPWVRHVETDYQGRKGYTIINSSSGNVFTHSGSGIMINRSIINFP